MGRTLMWRDDEALIVEFVARSVLPEELERISRRVSRDNLILAVETYIRCGRTQTERVVADAEAGDELSDFVLRKVFHDMLDNNELPSVTLRDYAKRPPPRRKRGRRKGGWERWAYNVGVVVIIVHISEFFGLQPTREQENRSRLPASACSIVRDALDRIGDHKAESTVQNLYSGLIGEIGRMFAADGDMHAHVRANLRRLWPQLVTEGPARLSRL
jgi:hypothetical protein